MISQATNSSKDVKQKVGSWLFRGAWIVEIAAVVVGLAIAAAIGWATTEQIRAANEGLLPPQKIVDIVIASLPLAIVAVVELCRIPLAVASYHIDDWRWRTLFLATLLLLITLNFETLSQGFMRQYQNLTYSVEKIYDELQIVNESLANSKQRYGNLASLSVDKVREGHLSNLENIQEIFDKEIKSIEVEFADPLLKSKIDNIDEQITSLRQQQTTALEIQRKQHQDKRSSEEKSHASRFQSLSTELQTERKRLDALNRRETQELNKASWWKRNGITARFKSQRLPISQSIKRLQRELTQLKPADGIIDQDALKTIEIQFRKKIESKYEEKAQLIENSMSSTEQNKIKKARNDAKKKYNKLQAIEDGNYKRELELVRSREEVLGKLEPTIHDLNVERTSLREKLNFAARSSPILSFARLVSGEKSAADIPPAIVRNVAIIWFSSIALIVAVTGTVLAFAAQVLIHGGTDSRQSNKTTASLRRLIVRIGKRMKHYRIKEVIKIEKVEKEKIVIKEVEKPVEVKVHHTKYRFLPVPGWGVGSNNSQDDDN